MIARIGIPNNIFCLTNLILSTTQFTLLDGHFGQPALGGARRTAIAALLGQEQPRASCTGFAEGEEKLRRIKSPSHDYSGGPAGRAPNQHMLD